MTAAVPVVDLRFPHAWQAEVLPARPLILPARHFVYPRDAEEVERGALEVLIRPGAPGLASETWEVTIARPAMQFEQPFLATCALGFRDPAVPTGLWSTPKPEEICAVSGGYAYLIDTSSPERFTMIAYRPVLELRPVVEDALLLFVGNRSILAWGREGQAWESQKLSDEGVTITGIEKGVLRGTGWVMRADKETVFALRLATGRVEIPS
ncbi:MAG: hypothetical protein WBE72_04700 [Terracidiphilus sp.]